MSSLPAYVTHPSSLLHEMGGEHPESPRRVAVINDFLLSHHLLDFANVRTAPAATGEQVARVHDRRYVDRLTALAPHSGYRRIDPDTLMNAHTLEAAWHAAGAAVLAAELVARGEASSAFCNVRPPGHHATRRESMGFCFFNNVAVGVAHALAALELRRIALVDFDVHHGNGSEDIFAGDPRVLMVSTFERGLYPFDGGTPRAGNMCNVGLEPYSGGEAMRCAVTQRWMPALDAFRPEMIFVSAGFDAHCEDDMSRLAWTDADYVWLTREIAGAAARHAHGRVVSVLEGGYSLTALARCAGAHFRGLAGTG